MNQKEAVKLAVMDEQIKTIGKKLDEHILYGKEDSIENKKAQEMILKKLDEHMKSINTILKTKADKDEVEKIHNRVDNINTKVTYWAGALAIIVFIITLIVTNIDKIIRGIL